MSKLNHIKTFRVDHQENDLLAKLTEKLGLKESSVIRLALNKLGLSEVDKLRKDKNLK